MTTSLLKPGDAEKCDFTCFETIMIGGSAVHKNLIEEIKKITPKTNVFEAYGMSETASLIFWNVNSPPGSCGKPVGLYQYRLADPVSGNDIKEPNVPGELRVQSPTLFMGYYNDPEETEAAFEDGWLKTSDMFYRDENWNFFFVDRLKQLLKYKSQKISPVEIEGVITQHPHVWDVAVVGKPDPECGDLPIACVVPRPGQTITEQEIKQLVKNAMTGTKQLSCGVIFMSELPMTATTKLHRQKLTKIVLNETQTQKE